MTFRCYYYIFDLFDLFSSCKNRLIQFFVITIINISMNSKNFHGNVEGENYSQTFRKFSKIFLDSL